MRYQTEKAINTAYLKYRKQTGIQNPICLINNNVYSLLEKSVIQKQIEILPGSYVPIDNLLLMEREVKFDYVEPVKLKWYQNIIEWVKMWLRLK